MGARNGHKEKSPNHQLNSPTSSFQCVQIPLYFIPPFLHGSTTSDSDSDAVVLLSLKTEVFQQQSLR